MREQLLANLSYLKPELQLKLVDGPALPGRPLDAHVRLANQLREIINLANIASVCQHHLSFHRGGVEPCVVKSNVPPWESLFTR